MLRYARPSILDRVPRDNHAVIEAGAGTGKTYTISHLVVELLLVRQRKIEEILVVTFTEKATEELRARIRLLLERILSGAAGTETAAGEEMRELGEDGRRRLEEALFSFDRAAIHTIHGFCQRVLSELAFDSGVRFGLDVVDSRRSFHRAFRAELRQTPAEPARRLLSEWLERKDAPSRENLIASLEHLLYLAHSHRYLGSETPRAPEAGLEARIVDWFLPRIADRLARERRERGEIEYEDMLAWLWRAIESASGEALVAALRARFRHALVDEFQDTDDLQWRIFRRLFVESGGENLLHVVGDPRQAIYGFRGADVFTYLQARDQLERRGAPRVELTRNFRSTASLIEACNLIFEQNCAAPIFSGEIRNERPAECGRPKLRALDAGGNPITPIVLLRAKPEHGGVSAPRIRAAIGRRIAAIARRILLEGRRRITIQDGEGQPRTVAAKDIFVLTRTRIESIEIGGYLREQGVPFAFYKQEGLFQTPQAYDILDVLNAIAEPGGQSRRLKAWGSPLFAVPFAQLSALGEVPGGDPLIERLFQWKALADNERFVELFDALLHGSGLVDRELFLADSERELTNYLHICEILLEAAVKEKLSLAELIARLESYIAGASPQGIEGNVQRIESERAAVQVMTVHMSKGLEADVVFIFGGMGRSPFLDPISVYHEGYKRRLAVGDEEKKAARTLIRKEQDEEDQRLTYVALTRARAKLYLPVFPPKSTKRAINGYYAPLNDRLNVLLAGEDGGEGRFRRLFEIEEVSDRGGDAVAGRDPSERLATWAPPEALLDDQDADATRFFDDLRRRHAARVTCSYTTLERLRPVRWEIEPQEFKYDLESAADGADLPGGRNVGLFLHEVIEKLELSSLAEPIDLAAWQRRPDVARLFADTMRRYQVRDPRWAARGAEIVFNTLRSSFVTPRGITIPPLYLCNGVREMEFVYPIPERSHPLLASGRAGEWTVERGYLKGFVDFVFEHEGVTYFADWKSDLLASYDSGAVAAHVDLHYRLQARIYSVGIVRLLRIRTADEYARRFGGLLYVFVRGVGTGGARDAIYFHRPSWDEIAGYEADLIGAIRPLEAPR